jgi:pyruvate formate-lyase/glycerol dehydratase family glycyl radical enzyme
MESQATSAAATGESRVARLRNRIVNAPQEVCVERARYLTESMSANWDEHPLTRISLALEHILGNISVTIHDDELVVGCRTSKLKGAPLFPENKAKWIDGDLDSFEKRVLQRALITEEEKAELREDILPFWEGRTVEDRLYELLPPDVEEDMDKYVFTMMLEITYGIGHFTMSHPKVLERGLSGIIDDVEAKLEALGPEDRDGEKGLLYEAMIRSMKAAVRFANRYGDLALSMAKDESDQARKAELEQIAVTCRRVPEFGAQSFREAVQSVYFIHLIAQIESGGNSISLGRIDQVLNPYYAADREAGSITPEEARELISLLFVKTCEIWNVLEEAFIPGGEGTEGKTTQNVTVGGLDSDGEDATTELSHIGLDAYADIRTVQPNFGVRISRKTPPEFFIKAADYARDDVVMHFLNDEAIINSLVNAGVTLQDARDYGLVGCVEPNAQGKTFGSTFAVQFNGIKCLEFALSNGIDNVFGYQSGVATGDPAKFTSFDQVWDAYDKQVTYFVGQIVKGMGILDQAIAELVPSPFASAMVEGPIDKGLDLTRGGAVYNSTGVQFMGFANTADSLYAVDKVVFEDGTYDIADLVRWMAEDWLDAEDKQSFFLNKVPKYGNDNGEVDEMAVRVLNHFCDALAKHRNYRDGYFWPGVFSVGFHVAMGAFTAATPDGRFAGDVLGNGLTPTTGNALAGATAVMNSVTRLPVERVPNGVNLNLRFQGNSLKPQVLVHLIRTYFDEGGFQVQFNMLDSRVLRDAQADPQKYRDLVVRVSGYSALFTGLSDTAQDEIISRTEYELT